MKEAKYEQFALGEYKKDSRKRSNPARGAFIGLNKTNADRW